MQRKFGRRSFIRSLGNFACSFSLASTSVTWSQKRTKRIGFLIGDAPTLISAFEGELQRLGYENGKNIIIEKRVSRSNTSDLSDHSAELAKLDLDLVLAASLPQALAMRRANPDMPMVIATCPGMISNGFAKSLARPGGIYTGMDELPPGVTSMRLRLLKMAARGIKNVALLSTTPGVGGHEAQLADAQKGAVPLKLFLKPYRATNLKELESALAGIADDRMNGMLSFQGGLSLANRDMIVAFAEKHRLPTVYQSLFFIEAGGLMAWAPDQEKQYRSAAKYVAKILKGANPGDLPVHFPDRYFLSVKKGAADRIGLKLPRALLAKADRIIE